MTEPCFWVYFKITPANQQFQIDTTDPIIARGLERISDNFHYRPIADNGIAYYECVAQISDKAFDMSNDCRGYKWNVENELIVHCGFHVTVSAKKITDEQFCKKAASIFLSKTK